MLIQLRNSNKEKCVQYYKHPIPLGKYENTVIYNCLTVKIKLPLANAWIPTPAGTIYRMTTVWSIIISLLATNLLLHNIRQPQILKVLSQFVIQFKPTIVHCYVRKIYTVQYSGVVWSMLQYGTWKKYIIMFISLFIVNYYKNY